MTRFFFDLQDDGGVLRDELGAEFGAALHAEQIAFNVARDLAAQNRRVRVFVREGSINVLEVEVGADVRPDPLK